MKSINAHDVKKNKQFLFDVRTRAEYESSHIPGSFNIPLDRLDEFKKELSTMEEDVVFVCRTGNRAGKACKKLSDAGLKKASVLDGGMQAWEEAGKEVNIGRQTWDMNRQVRFGAGLLVLFGVGLSTINPWFVLISGFVGAGLVYSGVTNTCGMALVLSKMPWNQRKYNVRKTVDKITR